MRPQAGVGGCGPTRGTTSAASARITLPTAIVPYTMIGWSAFGRMCRKMMRVRLKASARAASTNSSSLSDRKLARTIRVIASQPVRPSTRMTVFSLRPNDRRDRDREDDVRDREEHVGEPHHERVADAAEEAGERAEEHADDAARSRSR